MKHTHTPRPWKVDQLADSDDINAFVNAGDNRIDLQANSPIPISQKEAENNEWWEIEQQKLIDETNANARLIAAAPDLLAACEKALELIYQFGPRNVNEYENVKNIQQAIQKAKGGAT